MQINLNTQAIKSCNPVDQNSKPSFKGFVSEELKKHINKLAKDGVDEFIAKNQRNKLTKADVENEILKPMKTAYKELTKIMKDKFPDDIGVSICKSGLCENEPFFFLKHKDKTIETIYWKQWFQPQGESTAMWYPKIFLRFVKEINDDRTFKPSEIIETAKTARTRKENELLKEELNELKITDLDW